MQIRIKQSKGNKDRYVILSEYMLKGLRRYYLSSKPKEYLFFVRDRNKPISHNAIRCSFHLAVKKDRKYIEKLFACYLWFLGEIFLRLPLFDHETKGCCDGLEKYRLNRNQGAESTIAYWISHLTVLAAQEEKQ